ncbi:toxin RelE [Spirochaetia bacterium]|nr:toxin RelE [Spirochaetia bacterium]
MWEVEFTNDFEEWWDGLTEKEQEAVRSGVLLIKEFGPSLKFPFSTKVEQSRHGNMRELRTQQGGRPLRTFYAFDPSRTAILLIGGNKTGDDRFYDSIVPKADKIYDEYLKEIQEEKHENP